MECETIIPEIDNKPGPTDQSDCTNNSSKSDNCKQQSVVDSRITSILTSRYHLSGVQLQIIASSQFSSLELNLLEHALLPKIGWTDPYLESFLLKLSLLDKFPTSGLGEREGRIFSSLVSKRHYHFAHGIGRSGDLLEWQPKAPGSSLLYRLTNRLLLNFARQILNWSVQAAIVMPTATGMAIFFAIKALALPCKSKVIWLRADQKSAIKAINLAGYQTVVLEGLWIQEQLETDIQALERAIEAGDIAAVISTTSCFAPRSCDDIVAISKLCQKHQLPHLINNAYGLQSPYLNSQVQSALVSGRVDAVIQSGDKNFLIPVSCAIIYGPLSTAASIGNIYPGRASGSGIIDLFLSLLHLGIDGWNGLVQERLGLFNLLKTELKARNISWYQTPKNDISLALKLPDPSLGPMLFARGISGVRSVQPRTQCICGHEFVNWNAHSSHSCSSYCNVAIALGCRLPEINNFLAKLDKVVQKQDH